jgi:hypothetical protein
MASIWPHVLGIACLATSASVLAADAPAQPVAGSGVNSITQAAVSSGVLACASRINQVTQFISSGNLSGAVLFDVPGQPDQRLASVSMEVSPKEGPAAYASASFAPNQANGCGAVYEAVVYWPQSCETVASKQFSGAKKGRVLHKSILTLETNASARIFLMPAGSGCVSIKKELVQ